ncbi:unnamed protein product [Arabis nemorensis]|uniref:Uncharacterized protein n=1 Tax=Arabis nemorensis TaxID=586526 RepID=A0A565BD35_9BRAS|nr:unnamed protein product [Arabis nemorensis]
MRNISKKLQRKRLQSRNCRGRTLEARIVLLHDEISMVGKEIVALKGMHMAFSFSEMKWISLTNIKSVLGIMDLEVQTHMAGQTAKHSEIPKFNKGKRKISYETSLAPELAEMQEELKSARLKLAEHDEENNRRDEELKELRQSHARVSELEKLLTFLKKENP